MQLSLDAPASLQIRPKDNNIHGLMEASTFGITML